jgi:hypothetical protein
VVHTLNNIGTVPYAGNRVSFSGTLFRILDKLHF